MPTARSAWPERLLSEKVRTLWRIVQIKERGALPMIDRGDIRQAIDRCSNIWASLPGAGYISSSIRLTAWLQNSKKRNGQRDWCMSRVTAIISAWLSASSSAWVGQLIITVITPPTKPSATKMPENWSWRTRQLPDMQMRQRCCARCKIHEGVSWC